MRMSIALPIVAAFAAAAIGLSSPTLVHAKPKQTVGGCNFDKVACNRNCGNGSGEFPRNCRTRCDAAWTQCLKKVAEGTYRPGGGGMTTSGGVLSGNTNGGKPNPKAPIFGGSIGTIGGGVVKYNNR